MVKRLHLMEIRINSATMRAITAPICNHRYARGTRISVGAAMLGAVHTKFLLGMGPALKNANVQDPNAVGEESG